MQIESDGRHGYLSTACFHAVHKECRKVCKFCNTPCLCLCHQTPDAQGFVKALLVRETSP